MKEGRQLLRRPYGLLAGCILAVTSALEDRVAITVPVMSGQIRGPARRVFVRAKNK